MAVVAAVGIQPLAGQFPDAVGDAVEEVAVVRHHHHAAAPLQQHAFQPFGGLQIEMVGRLVHQQQVRFLQEQASQQAAGALPAAQVRQRQVMLGRGKSQPGQHLADAQFPVVAAGRFESCLQRSILGQRLLIGQRISHLLFQAAQLVGAAHETGKLG